MPDTIKEKERFAEKIAALDFRGEIQYPKLLVKEIRRAKKGMDAIGETLSKGGEMPGEEWLRDNFSLYLTSCQDLFEALQHKRNVRTRLYAEGPQRGLPLFYPLLLEYLNFCPVDGEEALKEFLSFFRAGPSLSLAEVAFLPLLLQAALVRSLYGFYHGEAGGGLQAPQRWFQLLKSLRDIDMEAVFQETEAEQVLNADPTGIYPKLEKESRRLYRNALSDLARGLGMEETELARESMALAENKEGETGHFGYYLLKEAGQEELSRGHRKPNPLKRPGIKAFALWGLAAFVLCIAGLAFLFHSLGWSPFLAMTFVWPLWEMIWYLLNHYERRFCRVALLPKLDFKAGLPEDAGAMVVVSALLPGVEEVDKMLDRLEDHFLANRGKNLSFAVLGDLRDSRRRREPADEKIKEAAFRGIAALNQKYPGQGFYFFFRNREYHAAERVYMAWERKRGALAQLNDYLRGEGRDKIIASSEDRERFAKIRYIVALDSDTVLPLTAAFRLVGAIHHPLQRPYYDRNSGALKGHGIVAPRMGLTIASLNESHFSRVYGFAGGLHPYISGESNFYQDLAGRGIFGGKGVYHVDSFRRATADLPENRILSHDLLEGNLLNAAYASDIAFLDPFPRRFFAYSRRQHRWVRGDFQLLPWLLPQVPAKEGKKSNPLDKIAFYQIIDNLRRPGLPILLLSAILLSSFQPGANLIIGLLLFVALFPEINSVFLAALHRRWREGGILLLRFFLSLALMPYFALLNLDAIVKTLVRLIRKRKLLEWETAAAVDRRLKMSRPFPFDRIFAVSYGLVAFWLCLRFALAPGIAVLPLFLAAMWFLAPVFLWALQRKQQIKPVDEGEREYLRRISLEIWAYFRDSITAEDLFLPPDNVQIYPLKGKARRTSPSNIGLWLSSLCLGLDLGYCGVKAWFDQLKMTMDSVEKLEKYQGHLYNWYDTSNGKVLTPPYVSAVDSGNFLASLYVLDQYLEKALDAPLFGPARRDAFSFLAALAGKGTCAAPACDGSLLTWRQFLKAYEGSTYGDRIWRRQMEHSRDEALAEAEFYCPADLPLAVAEPILRAKTLREMQNGYFVALERAKGEKEIGESIREAQARTDFFIDAIEELRDRVRLMKEKMDFTFLYDPKKKLLHIGYRTEEAILDRAWYDQLASEIRLTSYLLVGRGELPLEHWRQYGRHLNKAHGRKGLLSWSGTSFEYFLPGLFLKEEPHSLLGDSLRFALRCQKKYGRSLSRRGLPWGVSESAFYYFDWDMNYQYKAFGVPALALDHAAGSDLVFAPYASILALSLAPRAVLANLRRFDGLGLRGEWGFYEAVDYTRHRLLPQEPYGIVKNYMIHHQSMAFLALGNFLSGDRLKERFQAIPEVRAARTLLEEAMPGGHIRRPREKYADWSDAKQEGPRLRIRDRAVFQSPPACLFLREGAYRLFLNSWGEGYAAYRNLPLNPWRRRDFLEPGGHFFFLADGDAVWSATLAPVAGDDCAFEIWDDSAVYERMERDIFSRLTVFLLPDGAGEARLLRISNQSGARRRLRVCSYCAPLLGDENAYRAHKGFYKLFFRGEQQEKENRAYLWRRKDGVTSPIAALQGRAFGKAKVDWSLYGDREDFIGRGRSLFRPKLPGGPSPFSLDPILSLGAAFVLEPGESVTFAYVFTAAETKEAATAVLDQYETLSSLEEARHLTALHGISCPLVDGEDERVQHLTAALLYGGGNRGVYGDVMALGHDRKDLLYRYGLSGDRPIILLDYREGREPLLTALFKAMAYWDRIRFPVDAIVLAEEGESRYHGFSPELRNEAPALSCAVLALVDKRALDEKDLGFYYATASLILDENLFDGLPVFLGCPLPEERSSLPADAAEGYRDDLFWIPARAAAPSPAPWTNLLTNPHFGTMVSDSGAAFTWWENSRENPVTPWSNNPVEDESYEGCFFLCDGKQYPLLPWAGAMAVGHGSGRSLYRGVFADFSVEITVYVPLDDPVKVTRISVRNHSDEEKRLHLVGYARPLLGDGKAGFLTTLDGEMLVAKKLLCPKGSGVFLSASLPPSFVSGDRASLFPAGSRRPALSQEGSLGHHDETMLTYGCDLVLGPEEEKTVELYLGAYEGREAAAASRQKLLETDGAKETEAYWRRFLDRLMIDTPNEALNHLFNRGLLYQTVNARLWGRTSFYQCGGAFGFRDQLQDVLSLLYTAPEMAKAQILRHAARQFPEGDVLHWWHEMDGVKGVRTRFSDDRLWLPYVAAQYARITGDQSIWREICPYLEGEPLPDGVDEYYGEYAVGAERDDLYRHCLRAIDISLAFGRHGLPLMGSGDWNDGMNRVGREGRGESVWLGFFLYDILGQFSAVCRELGDAEQAADYESVQRQLAIALNEGGYGGEWYLRAYFDDGSVLGGGGTACALDSLSQSWAMLSGAGEEEKTRLGLEKAWQLLVDHENRLLRLFTPPFNEAEAEPDPGYIRDYPPGIRENGGQYTHGALWFLAALAQNGDTERAALLLDYLNPLTKTEAERKQYRLEPYVVAADVYSVPPYAGRGGWSWYTGAAAWFYRVVIRDILGLQKEGERLTFTPLALPGFDQWQIRYAYGKSLYAFSFYGEGPGPSEIAAISVDGKPYRDKWIELEDDGEKHRVEIVLRRRRKK